ncbi:MurR/RpiR family transcriptional regulator [Acetobacter sp.]|uniref:MurR/RpiR family transcriptional regulator n=1 Tax=Acetobacter sp. TaxID=440 RepID=UPI0039EB14E3
MDKGPLNDTLVAGFESLSPQLQAAARYVVDNPRDVALLSMREQARRAELQPATMTRLAKHLGYDGYDAIRTLYKDAMRDRLAGFADKAGAQAQHQKLLGDGALAAAILSAMREQVGQLATPHALPRIVQAAACLSRARTVYCLGLRASHPVAWHLHYILSLSGGKSVLLDGIAGTGIDPIARADRQDALLVVSIMPYTRASIEVAEYAKHLGVPIIALTDSEVSPLARLADASILVQTESPSFFHSLVPAFAVAEVLGALIAGHGGERTLAALQRSDAWLEAIQAHLPTPPARTGS